MLIFIKQIILSLLVIVCTVIATKLGIPRPSDTTLGVVALAIAVPLVGGVAYVWGLFIKWAQHKKIDTAEKIAPGITTDTETAQKAVAARLDAQAAPLFTPKEPDPPTEESKP